MEFLSEVNDCQKALLKLMSEISPLNFASIYIIDIIWKLVIIRFELLLNDEDRKMNKIKQRSEEVANRERNEMNFL
jgi:hypothetical protein